MTIKDKINGRKIGVVGMARSGLAAAALAISYGGHPFVSDSQKESELTPEIDRLKNSSIPYETGGHTEALLGMDYLVVSPGVPLDIPILKKAAEKGLPIFSEIEFSFWACRGKIIAVTGSNGKTTTTTLLGEIFTAAGFDTFVGGNIGLPFAEIVQKVPENGIVILELSNFQLETISEFRPDTALILNITPDHLDRHGTMENYKKAKLRITENQLESDCLILNRDDKELSSEEVKTKATRKYFTINDSKSTTVFSRDNTLMVNLSGDEHFVINNNEISIAGPHNRQNAAAAICAALEYGIDLKVIAGVLRKFAGVEHRLENVGRVAGIKFVNDSKATNIDSVSYALRSVDNPLYLIAGGRDKDGDFKPLIKYGEGKIKGIIAIGEAKDKIFDQLGGSFSVQFATSMEEAVEIGFELAMPGETVMLSPGCASFDMYQNFEQRGRNFKEAVDGLKNGKDTNETLQQK